MGLGFGLSMDSFQQLLRRFIVGVLGDEFAGEGAGEERGRERIHLSPCRTQPRKTGFYRP